MDRLSSRFGMRGIIGTMPMIGMDAMVPMIGMVAMFPMITTMAMMVMMDRMIVRMPETGATRRRMVIATRRASSPLRRQEVRLRGHRGLSLFCAALVSFALASSARAQAVIWRGRSAGYDVTWSDRDVSARRASDGVLVFSARRITDAEWAGMEREHDAEVPVREYERKVRLLSVVGSILSLEEATYCDCGGAHPISWTRFVSYDLARGTAARPRPVAATEVVREAVLLRALAADRLIRQAMDSAHVRSFASLRALTEALKTHAIQPAAEDCTYGVGEEFPTEFAFHHVESGRVAVRFSLGHYVEVCRGMMIQVGALVPALPRWDAAIRAASTRRAGYLMKDLAAIAGERRTVFNYRPGRR